MCCIQDSCNVCDGTFSTRKKIQIIVSGVCMAGSAYSKINCNST